MDETQTRKPRLAKRMTIMLIVVIVLFVLVIGFNVFKGIMVGKFMASNGNPPQTISTMKVAYQDWQPHVEAVGNVRAVRGVDLAFDVSGLVDAVPVKSGADVKAGQVLVQLRDADDRAKLAALQATAQLAELTARRSKQQLDVQAISRAQYDTDMANLRSAQAGVAAQAALVAKKMLRAPFSGRIGIITVNPGQYINPGDKVATLQQLDPVYVDFTLPQESLNLMRIGGSVAATTDSFPGQSFTGAVSATDPKVDPVTRNVGVEATLPNPGDKLVPGMFANIAIDSGGVQRYLTLPQTAVTYAPYGDTVFVLREGEPPSHDANGKSVAAKRDDKSSKKDASKGPPHYVEQVLVTTGPKRGDQVAILKGLKDGDVVATSGQLKLKNGTPVNINNAVQPAFNPNPMPVEQ
ncbi:MAG: efflux RND transporter periplasmic adaptor subunit [Rhodanobacteraceae bacterium]|nr:efflux RND transporter periplasmic adaptor subunit [Pseudomonadota bacterium]